MPNTKSAKKALRSSQNKHALNLAWKKRVANTIKNFKKTLENKNSDVAILNQEQANLQKVLDKAAKNHVIHQNKADRIKSVYANKITAHFNKPATKSSEEKEARGKKTASKASSRSKSKS